MTRALLAWLSLMLLLGVQLGCLWLPLGRYHLPVALALSVLMANIAAFAFMELGRAPRLAQIFAYAGLFWLLIMVFLGGADYATRALAPVAEPISRLTP